MRTLVLAALVGALACRSISLQGTVECEDTHVEVEVTVLWAEPEPGATVVKGPDGTYVGGNIRAEPRVVPPGRYRRYEGGPGIAFGF